MNELRDFLFRIKICIRPTLASFPDIAMNQPLTEVSSGVWIRKTFL